MSVRTLKSVGVLLLVFGILGTFAGAALCQIAAEPDGLIDVGKDRNNKDDGQKNDNDDGQKNNRDDGEKNHRDDGAPKKDVGKKSAAPVKPMPGGAAPGTNTAQPPRAGPRLGGRIIGLLRRRQQPLAEGRRICQFARADELDELPVARQPPIQLDCPPSPSPSSFSSSAHRPPWPAPAGP